MGHKKQFIYILNLIFIFCIWYWLTKHFLFLIFILGLTIFLPFEKPRLFIINSWSELGLFLTKIVSPILIFLVYQLAFIPAKFWLILKNEDPLSLKKPTNTNWKKSEIKIDEEYFEKPW